MISPSPRQGPKLDLSVIEAVIVAPHPGEEAKTDAGKKEKVEPNMVARSRIPKWGLKNLLCIRAIQV